MQKMLAETINKIKKVCNDLPRTFLAVSKNARNADSKEKAVIAVIFSKIIELLKTRS